ncbi:MAG: AEC family transporter, partial [Clostridiales bacterium]|nr:AEC family transporter [Clostridiales bacterium]
NFPLNAISMIGETTTPLSMLIVGSQLVSIDFSILKDRSFLWSGAARLILVPLTFWLLFKNISLPPMAFNTIFICLAMPGAAVTVIQANQFKRNEALAAKSVALTTVFSIVTIPIMLLLL